MGSCDRVVIVLVSKTSGPVPHGFESHRLRLIFYSKKIYYSIVQSFLVLFCLVLLPGKGFLKRMMTIGVGMITLCGEA